MLEEVFRRRVLDAHGSGAVAAAYRIAEAMAEDEELWVPAARFDGLRPEVEALLAEGILLDDEGGRRLGFRHQTLFDFVRARAFVASGASVADHALARQDALFVRPVVWSALSYLRSADPLAYRREFGRLWSVPTLRSHLRLLLVEFLAQQHDPSDREAAWFLPLLNGPGRFRHHALRAAAGNPGWFARLRSRLPGLMEPGDDETAWAVTEFLRRAVSFARSDVLELVGIRWLEPLRAVRVLRVIEDVEAWDDRVAALADAVVRSVDVPTAAVGRLVRNVARVSSEFAPRLVAARLMTELAHARSRRHFGPAGDAEGYADVDEGYEASLRRMLNDKTAWYGLAEAAVRAPARFVGELWSWFLEVCDDLAWPRDERLGVVEYRAARSLRFTNDHDGRDDDRARSLPEVLAAAAEAWATRDPDDFLPFVAGAGASDLAPVHRLLARGLARLAAQRPRAVLEYLLADSRRFALGDHSDGHAETCRLIAAAASHLGGAELTRLGDAVLDWRHHVDRPDDDARTRFERTKWNRMCRQRLLAAIPAGGRSLGIARLLEAEERALGASRETGPRTWLRTFGPPMTAGQTAKASDADILRLLEELDDATGRDHPRDWSRGGSVQASQAFGEFAKAEPERALRLIASLSPGRQERPVGYALTALAQAGALDPARLVALVHRLHARSFVSDEFRLAAVDALGRVAGTLKGLDDPTCCLLEEWLSDADPSSASSARVLGEEERGSVLWRDRGFVVLPGGNYPVLHALTLGLLLREPAAADVWLGMLERHLDRREDPRVWRALVSDLRFLINADRHAAVCFLERLFEVVDGLACSDDGAELLAWTHRWLPPRLTHAYLERWRHGAWPRGPQAAGELTLLRHALVPADGAVAASCRDALPTEAGGRPEVVAGFCLGMAHTAGQLWREDAFRPTVTPFWTALAATGDAETARALMDAFRRGPLPYDEHTRRLLLATIEHPTLLDAADPMFLIDRLQELLRDGMDAPLVASVATAIVAGKAGVRWEGSAGDLVGIALALQRLPETRADGTALFERLMETGTYEADDALRSLDRRTLH